MRELLALNIQLSGGLFMASKPHGLSNGITQTCYEFQKIAIADHKDWQEMGPKFLARLPLARRSTLLVLTMPTRG